MGVRSGLCGLLLFPPRDFVFCIVIMLVTVVGMLLMAGFRSNRWREHAGTVVADMPPGTPVRIDANGLTVGSIPTPWSTLKLAGVNLRNARPSLTSFGRHHVEQLVLDVAGKRVVLDAVAITHGQEIVDTIFSRLSPEP